MHVHHFSFEFCEVEHCGYNQTPFLFVALRPNQHFEIEWNMLVELTQDIVQHKICIGDSQSFIQSIELNWDCSRGEEF